MPSPVTHITGAYWAFDIPWVSGTTSVLMDVWSADEGIDCIEKNRCTVTGGATPFLRQLLDTAVRRTGAMASLRIVRRFLERAGLARQQFPEHLVTIDELPRVPSGKVSKDVLRARAKMIAEEGGA